MYSIITLFRRVRSINKEINIIPLKFQVFVIKEGVQYRIRIDFIVQREIVHGLKYVQKTYRLGVPGDYQNIL